MLRIRGIENSNGSKVFWTSDLELSEPRPSIYADLTVTWHFCDGYRIPALELGFYQRVHCAPCEKVTKSRDEFPARNYSYKL